MLLSRANAPRFAPALSKNKFRDFSAFSIFTCIRRSHSHQRESKVRDVAIVAFDVITIIVDGTLEAHPVHAVGHRPLRWIPRPQALLASVDQDQINLARLLGGTRLRTFLIVRLPACIGPLFSGLKIGASYAVSGAVIGEWSASSRIGLGTYLLSANAQMNTAGVYGAMLLLTAIGIGSFLLVVIAEYFTTPWRTQMTAPAWFGRRVSASSPPADSAVPPRKGAI